MHVPCASISNTFVIIITADTGEMVTFSTSPRAEQLLQSTTLYCIVLNYYTGTPLSPEDYFPGSPVKVEQQTYTHTTHNSQIS